MDVSVVVVSYNTRDLLAECLHSVAASAQDSALAVETFVVDNASRDGSAAMVAAGFPDVTLLANTENVGFARACNQALRRARGRHVLLLNPDAALQPATLARLVDCLDRHPERAFCGPRLVNADSSHQPSARRFPTVWTTAFAMLGLAARHPGSRHALDLHAGHAPHDSFPVDWLTGACLLLRRSALDEVGLLDESFFLYYEELDLCRRLAAAGWSGSYLGDVSARHAGGASVEHEDSLRPFWGNDPRRWVASSRRYLLKHHGRLGQLASHASQVLLHAVVYLRHRWRRAAGSRRKADTAAASIRYLLD